MSRLAELVAYLAAFSTLALAPNPQHLSLAVSTDFLRKHLEKPNMALGGAAWPHLCTSIDRLQQIRKLLVSSSKSSSQTLRT